LSRFGKHLLNGRVLTLIGEIRELVCRRLMRADNFTDAVQFRLAKTGHEIPLSLVYFNYNHTFSNTGEIIRYFFNQ